MIGEFLKAFLSAAVCGLWLCIIAGAQGAWANKHTWPLPQGIPEP
jgi:hypothetical protein